jgi:hypothetical protein
MKRRIIIRALQATTAPLAELDQLVARMHVTVEGLERPSAIGP